MEHQSIKRIINIASTLMWVWGGYTLLVGISVGYPALIYHSSVIPLAITTVWGVLFCLVGFSIRKRKWGVRWWGGLLCVISIVLLMIVPTKSSLLGLAINAITLLLIILSWRPLGPGDTTQNSRKVPFWFIVSSSVYILLPVLFAAVVVPGTEVDIRGWGSRVPLPNATLWALHAYPYTFLFALILVPIYLLTRLKAEEHVLRTSLLVVVVASVVILTIWSFAIGVSIYLLVWKMHHVV